MLEVHEGLNAGCTGHLWLLHHLFHFLIELDMQEWAITWNYHTLWLHGQRDRSPQDIFLFSHLQDGPWGIELKPVPPEEEVLDPASYGIDWEELDDRTIQAHFMDRQEHEEEFYQTHDDPSIPCYLNHVPVEAPNCPFNGKQVEYLDGRL
uniref:Uncharacterized protein n=1 Tax=Moniliophthora roreri TaxID=221103 RepID=A0A0W0EZL8_MONRR